MSGLTDPLDIGRGKLQLMTAMVVQQVKRSLHLLVNGVARYKAAINIPRVPRNVSVTMVSGLCSYSMSCSIATTAGAAERSEACKDAVAET